MEKELLNTFDKELLLKDLSARLSYHVRLKVWLKDGTTEEGFLDLKHNYGDVLRDAFYYNEIIDIKPYLFPLSSMTEEMLKELNANGFFKYRDDITNVSNIESKNGISKEIYTYIGIDNISFLTDYFHSHHIDYRGLIEKGLAIDVTNLNIY